MQKPDAAAFEVRPPWPDELSRVQHFLPSAFLYDPQPVLAIAVRGKADRIFGVAAMTLRPLRGLGLAALSFRMEHRPEWNSVLPELLRAPMQAAWKAGAQGTVLGQSIVEGSELDRSLRELGFAPRDVHEVYETDSRALWERTDRLHRRMAAHGMIPPEAQIVTLLPPLLAPVREFVAQHMPESASLLAIESSGYRPEDSLVLLLQGEVKGVLLFRRSGDTVMTGLRLIAPELRGGIPWANTELIHASLRTPIETGLRFSRFELNPGLHEDTRELVRTLGARLVEKRLILAADAGSTP